MVSSEPRRTTPATAALAVFWRVPQAVVEEFEEFCDCEHIPERMEAPGFLSGARLVELHQRTRQLALFDLAQGDVLEGDAYRALGVAPSAWARRIVRLCEVRERLVCSIVLEKGAGAELAASAGARWIGLLSGLLVADAAVDALAAAAGVLRCRLFHAPAVERTVVVADLIGGRHPSRLRSRTSPACGHWAAARRHLPLSSGSEAGTADATRVPRKLAAGKADTCFQPRPGPSVDRQRIPAWPGDRSGQAQWLWALLRSGPELPGDCRSASTAAGFW